MNPFIGYGTKATPERFVGRQGEIRKIVETLGSQCSISVTGLNRVGKTSLVSQALASWSPESSRVLILSLSVSTEGDLLSFYHMLKVELGTRVSECDLPVAPKIAAEFEASSPDIQSAALGLRKIFKEFKSRGVWTCLVLDEFDKVSVFEVRQRELLLKQLRHLLDHREEFGLQVVLISRRALSSIENQSPDVSVLSHVCASVMLKPFEQGDYEKMMLRAQPTWALSDEDKAKLWSVTGGFPYLIEMILCQGFEARSVHYGLAQSRGQILDLFENKFLALLKDEGLLETLITASLGQHRRPAAIQFSRLSDYGVFERAEGGGYCAFSAAFQTYLEAYARANPSSSQWAEVEEEMRKIIRTRSTVAPPPKDGAVPSLVLVWQERAREENLLFDYEASQSFLDYGFIHELWQEITRDWARYQSLFPPDRGHWEVRLGWMAQFRNAIPVSANKMAFEAAEAASRELVTLLRASA